MRLRVIHSSSPQSVRCDSGRQCLTGSRQMLVIVANWLRWRRLPKASPISVWLTHCPNACVWPKYCNRAMPQLSAAAASQALATTPERRAGGVSGLYKAASPSRMAMHAHANISGAAFGAGPGANGLSHGSTITTHTRIGSL